MKAFKMKPLSTNERCPLFEIIEIETINRCTRKCPFCKWSYTKRSDEKKMVMPMKTIDKIISNLKKMNFKGRISWFSTNDPFLDKRMVEIIRRTRLNLPHAWISLATNGELLTNKKYRTIRKAGLDALEYNIYDEKGKIRSETIINDGAIVFQDKRPDIANFDNFENMAGKVDYGPKDNYNNSCNRPFQMMIVKPDGNVILCCSDMHGEVVMDNINRNSLEQIWNSEMYQIYRRELKGGNRKNLKLCSKCNYCGGKHSVKYPF